MYSVLGDTTVYRPQTKGRYDGHDIPSGNLTIAVKSIEHDPFILDLRLEDSDFLYLCLFTNINLCESH